MKKQYVIESKGFKEGVGSFKYSQKRKNEIKELKKKILNKILKLKSK